VGLRFWGALGKRASEPARPGGNFPPPTKLLPPGRATTRRRTRARKPAFESPRRGLQNAYAALKFRRVFASARRCGSLVGCQDLTPGLDSEFSLASGARTPGWPVHPRTRLDGREESRLVTSTTYTASIVTFPLNYCCVLYFSAVYISLHVFNLSAATISSKIFHPLAVTISRWVSYSSSNSS
jgi:hypothetical protein